MDSVRKILGRAQRLQQTLLDSPITVTIESSRSFGNGIKFSFATFIDLEDKRFYFDSSMDTDALFQEWGRVCGYVNDMLRIYGHFEVTSAGNIKKYIKR